MDLFFDSIFHGLFTTLDPLGMILRTLMALLSDALAQLITGTYAQLFQVTTVDFGTGAVASIWRITTGLSVGLATILLVIAAFRSMLAQSNAYLLQAFPGVALAILGPQAAAVFLPLLAAGFTSLAEGIVSVATPDLAASMRLIGGVGSNPIYEGMGLMAPLIAALLLFGMAAVFFVLLFCMAGAIVLFVLSPFAFAGFVMAPTRVWFTKWATGMFALLFAKVPIAILLALSVSLFANSRYASTTQSFVNAGAGLILGIGALLAPLLAYGLFSFMGTVATRPSGVPSSPGRALNTGYYGMQMGRSGVNGMRTAAGAFRSPATPTPAGSAAAPAPHEPTAAQRSQGASVATPPGSPATTAHTKSSSGGGSGGGVALPVGGPAPRPPIAPAPGGAGPAGAAGAAGAGVGAAGGGAAVGAGTATAGTAVAAGAATGGVGTAVVLGAAAAGKAGKKAAGTATGTARGLAGAGDAGQDTGPPIGSTGDHRID